MKNVPNFPLAPAFLHPDGTPLTAYSLQRVLALTSDYLFGGVPHYTLHSLRRGAFQACVDLGVPVDALKEAGPWSSDAYRVYLKNGVISTVPLALRTLLG